MGLRRKQTAENQTCPMVDLGDYEIENDPTDIRIRLMEIRSQDDCGRIIPFMDKGDIIVISMETFPGSSSDAEAFIDGLRTNSRLKDYSFSGSGNTFVFAPNYITIKKT